MQSNIKPVLSLTFHMWNRKLENNKFWHFLLTSNTYISQNKSTADLWSPRTLITHTHTHPFNGPFSGTTQVSQYQKGKTNLDFTEAWDSEWQWHQLGHMQVCTLLQTENHTSTPPLCFLQAGCPSCRPTNSVKALKARTLIKTTKTIFENTVMQETPYVYQARVKH